MKAKIDIFQLDYVIFPMNIGEIHWAMGAIDLKENGFRYFDSMYSTWVDLGGELELESFKRKSCDHKIHRLDPGSVLQCVLLTEGRYGNVQD